jgi:hypothetical protein
VVHGKADLDVKAILDAADGVENGKSRPGDGRTRHLPRQLFQHGGYFRTRLERQARRGHKFVAVLPVLDSRFS